MGTIQVSRLFESSQEVFDCLSDATRRRVLDVLAGSSVPLNEEALALEVLAGVGDGSAVGISDEQRRQTQTILQHQHLPLLEEAGLIDWDRTEGTAASTDRPILDDPRFRDLCEMTDPESDDLIAAIADEHRRAAIDVLESAEEMDLGELAARVAERVDDGEPDRTEQIEVRLHHHHVPRLAEAGIVDYDADEKRIAFEEFPLSFDGPAFP